MVHFFSSLKSSYNSDVTMTSVMLPAGSSAGKLDLRYGARHQRHLLVLGRKENSPFAHFLSIFSVFFEDQIDSFLQDGNIGKLKQFTRNNASWDASLHNIIGHNGCKSCVEHETKVNELRYLFVFNSLITRSFLYTCYAFWERCVPRASAFEAEFVVERVGQEICNEKYYVKVCWNVLPYQTW